MTATTAGPRPPISDPLLLTTIRRMHADGWTYERSLARYHRPDGTAIVEVVAEGAVKVWRRPVADGSPFGKPDEYPVDTVRQAVDVLAALGILPADLSSAYAAGVAAGTEGGAEVYDDQGDLWRLGWTCVGSDGPPLRLTQVDGEFGPLSADPPDDVARCRRCGCTGDRACLGGCAWATPEQQIAAGLDPMTGDLCTACLPAETPGQSAAIVDAGLRAMGSTGLEPVDERPGPECSTPVPGRLDLTCGTTAVGVIRVDGREHPVCQAHTEIAVEGGLIVHPLAYPAARAIVAEIAPAYVRPVEPVTVDLSDDAVRAILDRLAAGGIEVHYHETDGDHYIDLGLAPIDADQLLVLSWYQDREGWRVTEWTDGEETARWPIGHRLDMDPVVAEVSAILADRSAGAAEHPVTDAEDLAERIHDQLAEADR